LPGKSPGWRSLVGCSPWDRWESDTTERLHFHFSLSCTAEGNGNPLQCSCLENPRDGGVWWAAVSGVAQSRTRLKRLSSSSKASSLLPHLLPWRISFLFIFYKLHFSGFPPFSFVISSFYSTGSYPSSPYLKSSTKYSCQMPPRGILTFCLSLRHVQSWVILCLLHFSSMVS